MPKVRSQRGTRTRFIPARIQATISKAYASAFGQDLSKWRRDIQIHSQNVIAAMIKHYGNDESTDWNRADIAANIEQELRKKAPEEAHEAYLDLHPDKKPRKTSKSWSKFEGKPLDNPKDDPLWSIQKKNRALPTDAPEPFNILGELGVPARVARIPKTSSKKSDIPPPPCFRSTWISFWQREAKSARLVFDLENFEKSTKKASADHLIKNSEDWWLFWQDVFEHALLTDPRVIELWRIAHQRRERARLLGQDWLDGSFLPGYEPHDAFLANTPSGRTLYRQLWVEHMQAFLDSGDAYEEMHSYDLQDLANALKPENDQLLGWVGWHTLATYESTWPVFPRFWKSHEAIPHHEAKEAPQWTWMRLAMALACAENSNKRQDQAKEFYAAFSELKLIPSEALLREAGKENPRLLEDSAHLVLDRFENVQEAIHMAATETKWNGTIALDWSCVRSEGAPVGGRRFSQGVPGFLKPIDLAQQALGRSGAERPVTVNLPVWHRDIERYLDLREQSTPRLQVVISIPDDFMECLKAGSHWWLLDPSDFPDLGLGKQGSYADAVVQVEKEPSRYQNSTKKVSAQTLWRRILKSAQKGSPFLVFEGSIQASVSPPVSTRLLTGLDGVGAFPIAIQSHHTPSIRWPTVAVNLASATTEEGQPDLNSMKSLALLGLRMLDNAHLICERYLETETLHYRPVCLGAIGYFEAISKVMEQHTQDQRLLDSWVNTIGEGWAMVLTLADHALTRERGAAACFFAEEPLPIFSPQNYITRLAQQREGSQSLRWSGKQDWGNLVKTSLEIGQRFSVKTAWAPFDHAARIAGVTPGGLGTLKPYHLVADEKRQTRLVPSALLLHLYDALPDERADLSQTLRKPHQPDKWPQALRQLAYPDLSEWNRRLAHAALLGPWVDQGVSLTLPPNLTTQDLDHLLQRAWWLGLANIRFEALDSESEISDDEVSPSES